jgi:hypothetical protein
MNQIIYIPDELKVVVDAVNTAFSTRSNDPFNVYYDFGHYAEVVKNLTLKGQSPTKRTERYPLVWLVTDYPEIKGNFKIYATTSLQIIIAMPTDMNYTMQQRRDTVFFPRLYPIYEELLNQISRYSLFGKPSVAAIEHTKIDRPYWGGQDSGNGVANLFNDFIDAVQIKNLKLTIKNKCG